MQFSTRYICLIAAIMNTPLLQVLAHTSHASGAVTGDASDPMSEVWDYDASKSYAKRQIGSAPGGKAPDTSGLQSNIINAINGFLNEPVPESATGTVFQLVVQYLEKASQGAGGGTAGTAAKGKVGGKPGKRSR
ncbi:hypothetical protein PTTG_26864 [Puccinia triticina 1-1 BBBD Race 1]|uniref:Uncharacterized protein n=2 Tax=Puccinia triticina TaxID=208348 RepID=A0A180GR79_PUCT1|nr:uncharacterized protein PtA15_2A317 [Puccinia triticina]OAV94899.1 hypothetical protein PTTG_26864 [Puccinia triticina 1-1 BBBD Race 1]WAQ82004.1 hypothetical protein PtA15_2A317 [Puccinia triticina]WAR52880.1 hypothetical protein PtB15_2B308 [Puccinia triticina]